MRSKLFAHQQGNVMDRRRFLSRISRALVVLGLAPVITRANPGPAATTLHLQDCRIAGSHYYDCASALQQLHVGDAIHLRRQTDNVFDERAIEIFWRNQKLGYLPRMDNAAAASLLDRAHNLRAEIIGLDDPDDEWEPITLRVWMLQA